MPAYGDVRLVGDLPTSGLLELYSEDEWGTVCDDQFGWNDAAVVCRQLGFSYAWTYGRRPNRDASGPIWPGFQCNGSEARLVDCPHTETQQSQICNLHIDDIEVKCAAIPAPPPLSPLLSPPTPPPCPSKPLPSPPSPYAPPGLPPAPPLGLPPAPPLRPDMPPICEQCDRNLVSILALVAIVLVALPFARRSNHVPMV